MYNKEKKTTCQSFCNFEPLRHRHNRLGRCVSKCSPPQTLLLFPKIPEIYRWLDLIHYFFPHKLLLVKLAANDVPTDSVSS